MSRQTRADSQAATRALLLETAERLFLADGYVVTSLERVAAEAGFSKGAVYSNFRGKTELCLAVLDRIHEQQAASMLSGLDGASTPSETVAAFGRWAEANLGNEQWTALEVEFATATRHDPAARAALATRRQAITALLADFLATQAAAHDVPLPMPAPDLAVAGLSLGIGLGVQRAVDPTVPVTPLVDLLRHLLLDRARLG